MSSHYMNRHRWRTRALEYLVYLPARALSALSRVGSVWRVGDVVGLLTGRFVLLVPGWRRRAEEGLTRVWPDMPAAERRRIVCASAGHVMRSGLEYNHLDRLDDPAQVVVTGGAGIVEALAQSGRGVIFVTAHYGCWEAIRLAARRLDLPTGIVYRAFNNRYFDARAQRLIATAGTPVLHKGREGMRAMMEHVSRGGAILILVDQRNSGAPFLPFLGHPAETVTVAAALARRSGAALVPAVCRRDIADRRMEVRFEPEIPPDAPEAMMTAVNDRISAWIEAEPEQWFWFHRRWRRTTRSRG